PFAARAPPFAAHCAALSSPRAAICSPHAALCNPRAALLLPTRALAVLLVAAPPFAARVPPFYSPLHRPSQPVCRPWQPARRPCTRAPPCYCPPCCAQPCWLALYCPPSPNARSPAGRRPPARAALQLPAVLSAALLADALLLRAALLLACRPTGSRPAALPWHCTALPYWQQQQRRSETPTTQRLRKWFAQRGASGGSVHCPYVICTGDRTGQTCGKFHSQHRCFSRLDDAWRAEFGDEVERPCWLELLRHGVDIFALDYDAILAAMHALSVCAEGDCYLSVPPDPGIEAAALGARESALPSTAPAEALHTFMLDSDASRCFFRDNPLPLAMTVEVAEDSGAARCAASGGAASGGAAFGGAAPVSTELGGAEPEGAELGDAEPEGAESELREWFAQWTRIRSGATGAEGPAAGGIGAGGAGAASPGGARTSGCKAAGAGGVEALELETLVLDALALVALELEALELEVLELLVLEVLALLLELEVLEVLELLELVVLEALELEALELEALELETLEQEALELEELELEALALEALELEVQALEALVLEALELETLELEVLVLGVMDLISLPPYQLQPQLQPDSPLPSHSPYAEKTDSFTERRDPHSRPALPVCASYRVPRPRPPPFPGTHVMALRPSSVPLRVPFPPPPASSHPYVLDPESDLPRAGSPTIPLLLATVVTDTSFESTAASALVTELVNFAESESDCPPSVWGECALGTDVLEDRHDDFECLAAAVPHLVAMLLAYEGDPDAPDIPTPRSYAETITGPYSSQWQTTMDAEMASWKSTGTYVDAVPPSMANIVDGMWIFHSPSVFMARYIARGFSQRWGVEFFHTFSHPLKMTTLRVVLHVAAQHDYKLLSFDLSTTFLQGSLHEEIWLRRPPGFIGLFPAGTQWSLQWLFYDLYQAPCKWHDTLRMALGFAPSTADPSLFLRTDTSLPLFYVLVYVDDLVFATADTKALALVKSELQKRHTCTDLGELRSYLGLQITRDRARRTITLTHSHMVQQVLQRFGFRYSSPQSTPLPTGHSLSAPPSDESV
ncbi:unnamed protein product, partial [Closterium sp. NIES-54]